MITLITWAPFLLFALLSGIIFMILGCKRGTVRAAVSVAATVISSVVAILIAKAVSKPIGKLFADRIVDLITQSEPEIAELGRINALAGGIAGGLSALVLFIPVFFLVCLIIKPIISAITKAVTNKAGLKAEGKVHRIGGLSLGLIDALLFSFLLTLPIYGTVSLAGDVYDTVEVFSVKEENEEGKVYNGAVFDTVKQVTDSPLASFAGLPPFSTVYDSLLTFKFEGSNVNLPSALRSVTDLSQELVKFANSENRYKNKKAILSLLNKTERFLLKNEFVTDVACKLISDKIPALKLGDMEIELVEYYSAIADGELLREDVPAFVDLLEAIIKSGMMEALEGEGFDTSKVDAEMVSVAFGRTLNYSPAIAAFKAKVVKEAVSLFTDDLINSGEGASGAIIRLRDAVMALPETPLSDADAEKEGEALYMLMSGVLTGVNDSKHAGKAIGMLVEGLARHPQISTDDIVETAKALLSKSGLPITEKLVGSIREKLNESISKPIGEGTFPDFCDATFTTAITLSGVASGEGGTEGFKTLITSKPEVLEAVKDTVTSDLLTDLGLGQSGSALITVIDSVFDAIIEADLSDEEAQKEAEALNQIIAVVSDVGRLGTMTEEALEERTEALIDACANSVVVEKTLQNLTEGGKSDPTGLFSGLNSGVKNEIESKIDEYISENGESAGLSALKLFVGINK